jgi:hypothetical protein
MPDHETPRFAVNPPKQDDPSGLPEQEYSAATYGAMADVVAEVREHLERAATELREGRI